MFTDDGRRYVRGNRDAKCSYAWLEKPQIGGYEGKLIVRARFTGRSAWPEKIAEIKAVTDKPVWVTEVGVSSFGAEEVQVFGLERTAQLLKGLAPRVFWYSLFDLPQSWGAETRHREAEGSSYYRHFYLGLIREDGTPKPALDTYAEYAAELGLMQWFHFEDPRLGEAVEWMKRLGTRRIRTGLQDRPARAKRRRD